MSENATRSRLRAPEPEDLDVSPGTSLGSRAPPQGPYSRYQLKCFLKESQNDLYTTASCV